MERLKLEHPGRRTAATEIAVGAGALEEAGRAAASAPAVLLVTDRNVAGTPWPDRVADACRAAAGPPPERFVVEPGDGTKTLAAAEELWRGWSAAAAGRDAVVLAVGGGVVTDLTGFAASAYLRGLPWRAVPTTTLAMADAAIGGKTGVNLGRVKNRVGAFWHPLSVHSDPAALESLPEDRYREGWAEVVKAAVVADAALFEALERDAAALVRREPAIVAASIAGAARVKCAIVARDPEEAGPREILNFGHTVAHAIETASAHAWSHGEAVAVGLIAEARLGAARRRLPADLVRRLESCCRGLGLPTSAPPNLDRAALLEALRHDKKRRGNRLRVAMPTGLGRHDPEAPCVEAEAEELLEALR